MQSLVTKDSLYLPWENWSWGDQIWSSSEVDLLVQYQLKHLWVPKKQQWCSPGTKGKLRVLYLPLCWSSEAARGDKEHRSLIITITTKLFISFLHPIIYQVTDIGRSHHCDPCNQHPSQY